MVGERENLDEMPEYGSDDLDIFFSFKVHHGGHFDVTMDNYNGGRINYFDYINIDELYMLDLDKIAMKLKYKLPVGYWIQLPRYGKPYQIMRDEELLWFGDKIPENRVIDLYLECIQPLQAFKGDELIPSQQPESQDLMYDTSDDEDNRASVAASDIEVNRALAVAANTEDGPTGFGDGPADLPRGSGSDNDDGSEDLGSLDGSNGEEDDARPVRKFIKRRYHEFNPRHDMQDPVFRLGMDFSSAAVFRKAIMAHSVKHRRVVKFKKKMIPTGLGSVIIKCSTAAGGANPRFQRLYICLGALKKGWKEGCRPILGLDGFFIKGHHMQQLLTAIGVDPNNLMYPVAYALMDSECRETWLWFLELLGVELELKNSHGIVWITDKQKGLIDAIRELFPHSGHQFCVNHFYNNFKASHRGLMLKQLLWGAAKSTTKQGFTQFIERLRIESEAAYLWLADKDHLHWSRAFFKDTALCDMLRNNMCEAFNSVILQARDKPVIMLIEMIRIYLNKRLVTKRAASEKSNHQIGPKVMKFVERIKMGSSSSSPEYSGKYVYQVKENEGGKTKLRRNYIVVRCIKCGQRGHNKTTCDKRGGRNVAGSEAGNANGGGPQPVQPRQASTQTQHA
ncbi:hypothetical protein Dsin_032413 [Dipteronia sinensis]|uniref:CCHC-type domain-containing protein n=1 Tax=Dipteronia sinensis TaxID=43782 RepID=A0AAD9ZNC1_9ROSI|nr:hypothetical protein Dsin_032413 [Dipteronia sinensis]